MNKYPFKVSGIIGSFMQVKADYVYYRTGALSNGATDDTILLTDSTGTNNIILQPGQGCPVDGAATDWQVYNAAGVGDITGLLLFGKGPFTDNRPSGQTAIVGTVNVQGTVDTIDGGKARTLAGKAFMVGIAVSAQANCTPATQLWNPPGSGKNLVIEKVSAGHNCGAPAMIDFGVTSAPLTANGFAIKNKNMGSAAVSVALTKQKGDVIANPLDATRIMFSMIVNSGVPIVLPFNEPVIVPPGYGFAIQCESATPGIYPLAGSFEWFEE